MANTLALTFHDASSFSDCRYIGSNGVFETGPELPEGIPNRIEIFDNACRMHLNTADESTADWKRTEIDFGEFSTVLGEVWSTFEFKYEWDFTNYIVIGSWSVLIAGEAGTTYVPIGFRIRNHCLVIQAPLDLSVIGFNNQDLVVTPIEPGRWYQVCTHTNLQSGATGFREVLLDGVPIVRQWNIPTTYATATGHYFKLGPYDGLHTAAFSEATMHIRNVAMWSGNDGYQTVMGTVPKIAKRFIDV